MDGVAAIIPAYNEAPTIAEVVRTVVSSGLCQDVIVVSDGSTDATAATARAAGATAVYELPVKGGKGSAMLYGVARTDASILFFLDADLHGLTHEHLRAILLPVQRGTRAMNVGLRDRGSLPTTLAAHLPLIGGERALRREVLMRVPQQFLRGYMIEVALNFSCTKQKLPYGSVPCAGLRIRRKMEKVGFWQGLVEYVAMYAQVFAAMVAVRVAARRGLF